MSRQHFRTWGLALPADEFAQAIAAVAWLGPLPERTDPDSIVAAVRKARRRDSDILAVSRANVAKLAAAIQAGSRARIPPAEEFARLWTKLREQWSESFAAAPHRALLRIELDPAVPVRFVRFAPALAWLLGELRLAGGQGVYVRADEPDRPVAWEWPIRVGHLTDARSLSMAAGIGSTSYGKLFHLVPMARGDEETDLLVLPYALNRAVARVLESPRRIRTDCALVLGGSKESADGSFALMSTLRGHSSSSGVGLVRVEADQQPQWFENLVVELSHDLPLDVALDRARVRGDGDASFLVGTRRLLREARTTSFARRLASDLKERARETRSRAVDIELAGLGDARAFAPEPESAELDSAESELAEPESAELESATLERIADEVTEAAAAGAWVSESGEATQLVDAREKAEAALGGTLHVRRSDPSKPAPANGQRDERRVGFELNDVTAGIPSRVLGPLNYDRLYDLALFIGPPATGVTFAAVRFPDEKLPVVRGAHVLRVLFVPMTIDARGERSAPQQARIELPDAGRSSTCHFAFRTHGVTGAFRAQILIAHENRVLQALVFTGPTSDVGFEPTLEVESVVAPGFAAQAVGAPVDAAIVVHTGSDGATTRMTTIAGDSVSFREPRDIDRWIEHVKTLVAGEAVGLEQHASLSEPELTERMAALADYGKALWDCLPADAQSLFSKAGRVQVVEAQLGAYLPVEFFHEEPSPRPGAPLCPHARAALLDEADHHRCEHRDSADHACPMRFWGFNRVIERQSATRLPDGDDYQLSVPTASRSRLGALDRALVAGSARVLVEDLHGPNGVTASIEAVIGAQVENAKDWASWQALVQSHSPTLLVLLPHSLESRPGIPALEIGQDVLGFQALSVQHVVGPRSDAPVVLLLGCSTSLPDVRFLSFVQAFKSRRAALVVGTLSTIRGRRAAKFVQALLQELKEQSADGRRTFGDALLATKRRLLANGDGFALSLVAYGDVNWHL